MFNNNIFYLSANLEEIQKIRYEFRRLAKDCNYDFETIYYLELVIGESLANAIKYGVEFDKNKKIKVDIEISETNIMFIIEYNGNMIDHEIENDYINLKDVTKIDELDDSGRGIFLIHKLMDRVEYDNSKNKVVIKMYKKIEAPEKEVPS